MSIFDKLAPGSFNNGSNDSQGKQQTNTTERNNDKNLLFDLSDSLGGAWKSITSVFSPSKPDHEKDNARHNDAKSEQRLTDKIDTATKAADRARDSALVAQNQIIESRVEHNNQFQNGKLPYPPQAVQKRARSDSESDQNPSPTKKPKIEPKTDDRNIQEFADGTFKILPSLEESISNATSSARAGKKMSQNIQNSWDNQDGFVGRHGNVNGHFDPHDRKRTAKFQGQKSGLDQALKLQNARSLQESSSESRLTSMQEAEEVAIGLAKNAKEDRKYLSGESSKFGRSRMNVPQGGGSVGRR